MKTIFLLFLTAWFGYAAEPLWLHDFEESKRVAKQKNLPILLMYSTEGCPECQYMKKKVFNDTKIANELSSNFVLVTLDIHKDKLPFEFIGIPTFFFTKPDGSLIDKKIGGSREKEFLAKLNEVKLK